MIKEFKENEARASAPIFNSTFEQIKMLYSQDKEKAGEFAISAIEMMLTGEVSTDDFMIIMLLKGYNRNPEEKRISNFI